MAVMQFRPTTELFGPLFENLLTPVSGGSRLNLLRAPEADVIETQDAIRVVLDVPGLSPDDLEINLENNVLTISGEKRASQMGAEEGYTWHLSERRFGKFSRSFILPRDVEHDGIEARFENGVLYVSIPKSERARRRRIEIHNAGNNGSTRRVEAGASMR